MAELDLPPIDFQIDVDNEMTPQVRLASELLAICRISSMEYGYFVGDTLCATTTISHRVNMFSRDESKELAMRVVINPGMTYNGAEFGPSHEYLAMTLEYGELEDTGESGYVDDDHYDWRSYLSVIVDLDSENSADVVNAKSGEPLDDMEMNAATIIVEAMRREVVANVIPESYETGTIQAEYAEVDAIDSVPRTADELSAKLYHPYPCQDCVRNNIHCVHPMAN